VTGELDTGGHRVLPHTADVIVEAWGPTRTACLEETVRGVVGTFADVVDVCATREVPLEVNAALDEDMVVALLDNVCYLLDASDLVVIDVALEEDDDGSIEGMFFVAPVAAVQASGAPPKGISRSDLAFERTDSHWHCHVVIDV
jgi:SHS2 domain-containing protein